MVLCVFRKLFIFAYFSTLLQTFSETLTYEPIKILFLCYFDFQKLKEDLENLFSYSCKVNVFLKSIF